MNFKTQLNNKLRVRGLKIKNKHSTEVIDKTWKRVSNRLIYLYYRIFFEKANERNFTVDYHVNYFVTIIYNIIEQFLGLFSCKRYQSMNPFSAQFAVLR